MCRDQLDEFERLNEKRLDHFNITHIQLITNKKEQKKKKTWKL